MGSLIPGVVSAPSSPGGGGDAQGFVQIALQLKQMKMQQEDRKRTQAMENIDMLQKNPAIFSFIDPKQVEGWFKDAGMKIAAPPTASGPSQAQGQPPQPLSPGGVKDAATGTFSPEVLSHMGPAMQGSRAGAQSGTPPSKEASQRNPGGGVNIGVIPQLGQDAVQRWGALAPLYTQGMDQLQVQHAQAQYQGDVAALQDAAAKGDMRAMGRLYAMAGKPVTDADIRNMIISSNMDPKVVNEALMMSLGHESQMDQVKRQTDMLKTIAGTPSIMERMDPRDVPTLVNSITQTGQWPQGVRLKNQSTTEMLETAKMATNMMEKLGYPAPFAFGQAQAMMLGIPNTQTLPRGFQTVPQLQAQQSLLQTSLEAKKVDLEKERLQIEYKKDAALIDASVGKDTAQEFHDLVEAKKAGVPISQEIIDGVMAKLGKQVGLEPTRVNNLFHFLTGGTHQELVPRVDTDALQGQSAPPKKGEEKGALDVLRGQLKRFSEMYKQTMDDENQQLREKQ